MKKALSLVCGKLGASDIGDAYVHVTNARVMKLLRPDLDLIGSVLYFSPIFLGGLPARKRHEGKNSRDKNRQFLHCALYPAGTCTRALGSIPYGQPQSDEEWAYRE